MLVTATVGALVAVLIPLIYFTTAFGATALPFVLFFSALHVFLIGVPVFFAFHRLKIIRWWTTLSAGFIGGAFPMAVYSWPYDSKGASTYTAWNGERMVEYVVGGVPSSEGWLAYVQGFIFTGLLGAASALGYWLTWKLLTRPNSSLHTDAPKAARP